MYEHNDIKLNMAVIVGDVKFPTPIFSDKMSYVVLNPSWNIPGSIAKNEIIPKLLKDPKYLQTKGIDIYAGWNGAAPTEKVDSKEVLDSAILQNVGSIAKNEIIPKLLKDPKYLQTKGIDIYAGWNGAAPTEKVDSKEVLDSAILQNVDNLTNFRFSQTSNKENPLGKMKFMFPNKHSVYIHDTPVKHLFGQVRRAFSHGCIRLSKPDELLSTIASEDKNLNIDKAHEILANEAISERTISLEKKIPIHIVYLTSWVDENDVLQFREDIYNFDKMQKELLF
jgi:murein L,D-transpeptidase YcbB/YkuD